MANEIKISAGRNSVCECLAHLTHQMSIDNFLFGDEESKTFLNLFYSILFWLLSVYYMQFWFFNKWNTLGAHCLLFLSFSLKKWRQPPPDGCRYKRWIWVVQVIESKKFASSLKCRDIPYKFSMYKTSDAFTWTRLYFGYIRVKQEKDDGEKFLNELFIVMQSRVFPLSMCVMHADLFGYFHISIDSMNKARTIFFFYSRSNTEM